MKKRKPLTDDEGGIRELMSTDMKEFRAAEELVSPSLVQKLTGRRMTGEMSTKGGLRVRTR